MEYLYAVVLLCFCVTPTSPIGAHHVGPVSYRTEIEPEVFGFYNVSVAHPHCHPVRMRLLDLEGHLLHARPILEGGPHHCKFVPWTIATFDQMFTDNFDVRVLVVRQEMIRAVLPDISILLLLLQLLAKGIYLWLNLIHVFLDICAQILSNYF